MTWNVCENKDIYGIMHFQETKIWSLLFMCILNACKKNLIKSSTTNADEGIPCGCLMSTIWAFDGIKAKHDEAEIKVA